MSFKMFDLYDKNQYMNKIQFMQEPSKNVPSETNL